MSAIHRHEPELFEDQEQGVCHHSEKWCERCNPALRFPACPSCGCLPMSQHEPGCRRDA